MARSVNIWHTWTATGQQVQVPQYDLALRIEWVDDAGDAQEWEGTITFPNVLAQVPASWVAEKFRDMAVEGARIKLGIDS